MTDPTDCVSPAAALRVGVALASSFLCAFVAGDARAQATRLNPLETVRLQILNWDPVEEAVRDWPAISGEYRVDMDGVLTVPFIGPIPTRDLSTADVAAAVANGLRERFALSEAPVATLDPVDAPTVVVGGVVGSPGAVEYRPGMTVRHALALAGGLGRTLTPDADVLGDYIGNQGQLRILDDRLARKHALLARLEAERNEADEIVRPARLDSPEDDRLLAEQAEILDRRRQRLASDLDALASQIDLYMAEVGSLEAKVDAIRRQRELAQETLENAQTLAERGLTRSDRLTDAERTLISVENQLLDTSTAILRARQAISVAMRERETLVAGRMADIVQQILDTRAEIAESEARFLTTERLLLADAGRVAALASGAASGEASLPPPRITIYRAASGVAEPDATLETRLEAGDLVDISLPASAIIDPAAVPPLISDIN